MIDPATYIGGVIFGFVWQYGLTKFFPSKIPIPRLKAISLIVQVLVFAGLEIFLWGNGFLTGVILVIWLIEVPRVIEEANNYE